MGPNAPRRKQQRTSCDTCRRRKTRCNVAEACPCSVCAKSMIPCRITPEWSVPRSRRRRLSQAQSDAPEQPTPPETISSPHPLPTEPPRDGPTNTGSSDESSAELASIVTEKDRVIDGLARDGLSQFYQRGVDSTHWTVFADSDHIRQAYMGTGTSNIAHLISLKRVAQPSLHLPYPPIRPPLPWKPDGVWGSLGNLDIAHDTVRFPSKEIRDALVDAFFVKIFPGFPIVDETTFRRQYSDRGKPPPLLLFQAVLLAGAHACEHPTVAASRMVVKRTLFRRASMLFHIRHENDRLQMAQAALLFVWHLENSDSVCGGSYYWLGIAQRIAFGMGMHRDLSSQASSRLPAWERRLNRRIWWTMFQLEVFTCLEHGRPCMINWNDTDQPALELQDFIEVDTEQVSGRVQLDYIMRNINISLIGFQILQVSAPSIRSEEVAGLLPSIEKSLVDFALDLPPMTDFWSCQLRMHYNLVLLHFHRPQSSIPSASRSPHSQQICSDASQTILSCIETIVHGGWTGQCSFTAVSAVMASAIQMSLDARSSLSQGTPVLALNAQDRLSRLLRCARELENFWPSAGAARALFDQLSAELKDLARQNPQPSSTGIDHMTEGGELPIEWVGQNPIDAFNFGAPTDLVPEDWMNDAWFLDGPLG